MLSNAFNDHFSSIGPKLANISHANEDNSSHVDYLAETGHCTFDLRPTSVSKVLPLYPDYVNQNLLVWTQFLQTLAPNVLI